LFNAASNVIAGAAVAKKCGPISQGSAETDFRRGEKFYFSFLRSLSLMNAIVKMIKIVRHLINELMQK